jgi:hypothetical protein
MTTTTTTEYVNVTPADLLEMLEECRWRDGDAEELEGRLNNIRDTLRFILHDAGVRVDPDIAQNDGNNEEYG